MPESFPIPVLPTTGTDADFHRVFGGRSLLGMPQFPHRSERRFRAAFAASGALTRVELHVVAIAVLVITYLTQALSGWPAVRPAVLTVALGVAVAAHVIAMGWNRKTGWNRHLRTADHRSGVGPPISAWSFVAAQFITLGCVLTVHLTGDHDGHGSVPQIVIFALVMSTIFVHLTFAVVVAVTTALAATVAVAEWLTIGRLADDLTGVVVSSAVVCVALAATREAEFIGRRSWAQQRRITMLNETDPLTGIANRTRFASELIDAGDDTAPLSILLFDIGGFKMYNDRFGHPAGDEVLRAVALHLRESVGDDDTLVARIAGKRFAIVWRGTVVDPVRAVDVCTAAAAAARDAGQPGPRGAAAPVHGESLYVSAGLAHRKPGDAVGMQDLVGQAEGALLRGRKRGRDVVATAFPGDRAPATSATIDLEQATESLLPQHPCPYPLTTSWRDIAYPERAEAAFRKEYDARGIRARSVVLLVVLVMDLATLLLGGPLNEVPEGTAAVVYRILACVGVPAAFVGLVAMRVRPWRRWSAPIFVTALFLTWCGGLASFIVLGDHAPATIPMMGPIALVLSAFATHVVWRIAMPVGSAMLVGTVLAGFVCGPITGELVLSLSVAVLMGTVAMRSAYRMEILQRQRWRRSQHLAFLGQVDLLTMLANRRAFEDRLHTLVADGRDVTVLLLDIDSFGSYNRRLGHAAGDGCLRRIGGHLASAVPSSDAEMAARIGGEEFAVLIRGVDPDRAREVWNGLSGLGIPMPGGGSVTASAGVAVHVADPDADPAAVAAGLLARADAALYGAKRSGRNRLRIAPADRPELAAG